MNMLIDKLVKDWAWRVNDGCPDPSKKDHLDLLEQSLRDYKYSEEFIKKFISEIDFTNKADFAKYKSKHNMRPTTKVNIGGKDTTAGEADPEKKKAKPKTKSPEKPQETPSSKNQNKLKVFIDKIDSPEQRENAIKVSNAVGLLDDPKATPEDKAAIVATLVADGLVERNASGSKLYMASKTGMPHKALGDPATKSIRDSMAALGLDNIPLRGKQLTLSGKKLVPNKIFATDGKLPTTDVKIEKTNSGVKIDGVDYNRQPEISRKELTELNEVYGNEQSAIKAERAIKKHNELIDKVEQVLVKGGQLNVVSPLPNTPPTTPENRKKLRDHTSQRMAETIEANFPEDKRSPVANEVIAELKSLKDIKDPKEYDEKLMGITNKIFEDEVLSTGAADLVETISYTRALNKGKSVYLPSASNFPLGDVLSISTEKIDIKKDTPEDISRKVEALTFGIENRSIKKGAGGASASNGKVKLTNFKEINGINPKEVKSDMNNLTSKSYDDIFDGDTEKSHKEINGIAEKYGVDLESDKYKARKAKSVNTAVLAIVTKNPSVDQKDVRKKLNAYFDLGHTFAETYNKTVDQQLFTNEVWKYSNKEKKVIVDKTDGIDRISKCVFAFSVGWSKSGRPTNKVPTRFKNVDRED